MEALAKIRKERGWSQRELGRRAGVDQSTINQAERGKRAPAMATLERLADALDVAPGDLIGGTSDQKGLAVFLEQQRMLAAHILEAIEGAEQALAEKNPEYARRFLTLAKDSALFLEEGQRDALKLERRNSKNETG